MSVQFFVQDCISKGMALPSNVESFQHPNELAHVTPYKTVVFCSINIARYLQSIDLGQCLILDDWLSHIGEQSIFDWNVQSTILKENLLNHDGKIFPFHQLQSEKEGFVRPNSGWKPFTGFDFSAGELEQEKNAIRQVEKVNPFELCVFCEKKQLSQEFRFWIIEGEVVTHSSYSFDDGHEPYQDDSFLPFVNHVVQLLETTCQNCVIDVCCDERGDPKVVEVNAISTSGWYGAMEPNLLVNAIEELYLHD